MGERRLYRKTVSFVAEFTLNGKNRSGFINNLSKNGLLMKASAMIDLKALTSGEIFDLQFKPPSGEILRLNCKVKWLHKNPPLGLTNSFGIEIIDPPPAYQEFLKTL